MPTLFRRKSSAQVIEPVAPVATDETPADARTKSRTPSKRELGVVTPKRTGAQVRRITAPPANRREAMAQTRDARRKQRLSDREAMMNGEEHALMPRDRGADRALVRDIVDARRNVSSYFFGVTIVVMVMSLTGNIVLANAATLLFLAMMLVVIVDSFLLIRRVKQIVATRQPKDPHRWGALYFYAFMRAISFRRMRVPRPRRAVGDKY